MIGKNKNARQALPNGRKLYLEFNERVDSYANIAVGNFKIYRLRFIEKIQARK